MAGTREMISRLYRAISISVTPHVGGIPVDAYASTRQTAGET